MSQLSVRLKPLAQLPGDGRQVAGALCRTPAGRPAGRAAAGRAAPDHRRQSRTNHHQDPGTHAPRRHALEQSPDGEGQRAQSHTILRIWHAFGLQPHRPRPSSSPPTRCSSRKCATSWGCIEPARSRAGPVRGRKEPQIQALDRTPTAAADAPRPGRAAYP